MLYRFLLQLIVTSPLHKLCRVQLSFSSFYNLVFESPKKTDVNVNPMISVLFFPFCLFLL